MHSYKHASSHAESTFINPETVMGKTFQGLTRGLQILRFLIKYRREGVFHGLDFQPPADIAALTQQGSTSSSPEAFVRDLETLGPTFIKIGQALSTRPDLVSPPYLEALARMQDEVSPIDFQKIREVVEKQLGIRLHTAFPEFDPIPIGCASLAQVHRALLRDGREVAVKVQRPEIATQIRTDLDALAKIAGRADQITRLGRRVHLSDWIHEFRRTLLSELDYRLEADNLERFANHLAAYPRLLLPQPIWDLSGPHVLTMDYIRGTKITEIGKLRRIDERFDELAASLLRGYLDQTFIHGEIHADPHPGNLLITADTRLAIFDLGMVAHVPPQQRQRLLKLMLYATFGQGEQVAGEMISLGVRLEDFDEVRFVREVSQLVSRYAAHSESRILSEGHLMLELTKVSTDCSLRTPPELSFLGKTLLNLEGTCRLLDPDLDVKAIVESHLEHLLRNRLRSTFTPASIATGAVDLQAMLQDAPHKISAILSLLADNRMQFRVTGLQESRLIENLQKIANRITVGVIIAALILASAMLMRGAGEELTGYMILALALFIVATALGLAIVISVLLSDRRAKPREEHGPRA